MHTIYKFNVKSVPVQAVIKHVDWDSKVNNIQVWAEVFLPYSTTCYKDLTVIGTGWDIPLGYKHIGTVLEPRGYVWHVYENKPSVVGEAYAA